MKEQVIKLGSNSHLAEVALCGKKFSCAINANGEVTQGGTDDWAEEVKALPRLPSENKSSGEYKVKGDDGKIWSLGYRFQTQEERDLRKTYKDEHRGNQGGRTSSSGGNWKEINALIEEFEGLFATFKGVSKKDKETMEAFLVSHKREDPAIKAREAKCKALGITVAEYEAIIAARKAS